MGAEARGKQSASLTRAQTKQHKNKKTDDIFPGEAKKQLFYAVEHLDTEPKGD